MLTDIEIDEGRDANRRPDGGIRQRRCRSVIVNHRTQSRTRMKRREIGETIDIRSDRLTGEEDVFGTGQRRHLRLGDGGALDAGDSQFDLASDQFRQLVGLDMRAEPGGIAGNADHLREIPLDALGINQQGRRRNLRAVLHLEPRLFHGQTSSKMTSISTAMLPGNGPIPTALRAPTP